MSLSFITDDALPAGHEALANDFAAQKVQLSAACQSVREKQIPLLEYLKTDDECDAIVEWSERIKASAKQLVVIGTGGSSLGGKTLASWLPHPAMPIHFLENIDPFGLQRFLEHTPLDECFFVIISKSGGTVETLSQALLLRSHFQQSGKANYWQDHTLIITEAKDSLLTQLAQEDGLPRLAHHAEIGGRYAALTAVGLLPAAVAGADIRAIRAAAAAMVVAWEARGEEHASSQGAALHATWMQHYPNTICMPYADALHQFTAWWQQLWAESLGKSGKGSTPVAAHGTVDQHSQLQLWLDGPKDKTLTLFSIDSEDKGAVIPQQVGLPTHYENHTIGTLFAAMRFGTESSLRNHAIPFRRIHMPQVDEAHVAELLTHFFIETIVAAELIGVNAFDQPAVEAAKQSARDFLASHAPQTHSKVG